MIPGKPRLDLKNWQKRDLGCPRNRRLERSAMKYAACSWAHPQKGSSRNHPGYPPASPRCGRIAVVEVRHVQGSSANLKALDGPGLRGYSVTTCGNLAQPAWAIVRGVPKWEICLAHGSCWLDWGGSRPLWDMRPVWMIPSSTGVKACCH